MSLLVGCATANYAFWEKFGYEKRDILVSRVEDAKNENKEGEEPAKKSRRLQAKVGVRNDKRVEIIELTDPDKKQIMPIRGLLFVIEGGHGLHDGDSVKIEEEEKH